MNNLRVLGIDPGFDRMGFGVVDHTGSKMTYMGHGCIQTSAKDEFTFRLQQLRDGLHQIILEHKPSCVAIEQLFFQTNAKTAIKVGMARGVIVLVAADAGLPIVDVTPAQVKLGLTGWGGADKKQIQQMVQRVLSLEEIPKPDDAADALAMAIVGGSLFKHTKACASGQ